MRRLTIVLLILLVVLVGALFAAPTLIDRALNRNLDLPHPALSDEGARLHRVLQVADMHADPLLWQRDLGRRISWGHVDVPRLIEGNVALQIFSVPTQVPLGLNYDANELRWDMVTSLALFQGWPAATWRSPLERALYAAERLHQTAEASGGKFRVLHNRAELDRYLAERRENAALTAGVLSIEGLHAIEGDLGNLDKLRQAGFRMLGLAHFFDNDLAGSAHGISKAGLTDLGRKAIVQMQATGLIVDLAHSSPQTIDEVLAMTKRPVAVSHVGLKGTCDTIRNLDDARAKAIAATGGVIGIGCWDAAICDVSIDGVVKAIRYGVELVGADAIGLGSDFDGATHTPYDSSQLALLTDGLLRAGLSEIEIRKVMGENVLRLLRQEN